MSWRHWIADLAFVVMESLSTFVLAGLVTGIGGHHGPGIVTMVFAALGGFLLARLLRQFELPRQALAGAALLLSIGGICLLAALDANAAGLSPNPVSVVSGGTRSVATLDSRWSELAGLAFVTIAWIRGALGGARSSLNRGIVLTSLTIGLVILAAGLSVGRASVSSRAIDQAALPFFTAGLVSLALINLNQSEHIRGGSWRGPWLLVVLGTVACMVTLAALSGLLPLDTLDTVLAPLGFLVLLLIDALIYLLALPTVILLNWILTHLLRGRLHPIQLPPSPGANAAQQLHGQSHHGPFVLALFHIGHVLLVTGVLVAVIGTLWWAYSRLRRYSPEDSVLHEPIEHDLGLASDLRSLLQGLLGRFGPKPRLEEPRLSPRLQALRRLYLSLLGRAALAGYPRPTGATPREFASTLQQGLAEPNAESLSYVFSAGRYGLIEPSDETLRRLSGDTKSADGAH
jgi:hypothetical protein